MELNQEALEAYETIEKGSGSVLITGRAGTGKSTFIHHLKTNTSKKIAIAAPTGLAAINARGVTLHSLFQFPFGPIKPNDERLFHIKYSASKRKLLRELQVLVIDEVSMVRADLIDAIDCVLRQHSKDNHLPFGGKQLVFVGDPFQLEPIVTSTDRFALGQFYQGHYFFFSQAYHLLAPYHIDFQEVYRQENKYFISLLDKVRLGTMEQEELDNLNFQYKAKFYEDEFVILLAARRETVEQTNKAELDQLNSKLEIFNGVVQKQFPESQMPTSMVLALKVGSQVMFVKNDLEKRWVNGTLAKVIGVSVNSVMVRMGDGREIEVKPDTWANVNYFVDKEGKIQEETKGTFTQLPLQLAWAVTIHKSQGLTFDKVRINMARGAFAAGQLYVALSRCRTLEGISLDTRLDPKDIKVHPEVVAFMNGDLYLEY